MKKKILLLTSTLLVLTSLVTNINFSKNDSNNSVLDLPVDAGTNDTYSFLDEHKATNTIHRGIDSVTYGSKAIIKNSTSTYKLVHDGSDDAVKLCGKIRTTINSLFNLLLETVSVDSIGGEITNSSEYIVFSTSKDKFSDIFPSEEDIKDYGYGIKTKGNSLYVLAYGSEGMKNAYNAVAKVLFGYEPLFELDVYTYNGEPVTKNTTIYLPNCDIVERPDFYHRERGQTLNNSLIEKMNYHRSYSFFYRVGDGTPHNSFSYLPPATYKQSHPKWYSTLGGQLCYTAHGDQAEYDSMVKAIGDYCVNVYNKNHADNTFLVGQQDAAGNDANSKALCTCEHCLSKMTPYYNPATPKQKPHSALMISFFNDVDDYIQTQKNINDIKLIFFAYQDSMIAPYDPQGTLKCHDNVGIYCAPSRASYTHSFYDPMQKDMEKDYPQICKDWAKATKNLYFWMYQSQFQSVLYPFQSWSTTIDNCRFAYECNGVSIFPEGDEFNSNLTAFGRFKDYLYAKGMYNVNSSYYELKDFYFKHYYGSAGEIMEEMFDQIVSYLTVLADKENAIYQGKITEPGYNSDKYWNVNMLLQWQKMVNDALKAVEEDRKLDPANYETYKSHVEIEGVFPNYALLDLFTSKNEIDVNTQKEIATQLATWCRNYGIQYKNEASKRENKSLDSTFFTTWGV